MLRNVLITCSDNLKGLTEGVAAIFKTTQHQICIVHQIRNSTQYVSWKDRKAFVADLKSVYQAINLQAAGQAMDQLEDKWKDKYPYSIKSWRTNWEHLTVFFEFPMAIRKIIYTTNVIESFNSMVRRQTAKKTIFPSDESVFKSIYLALEKINKKWKNTIRDWGLVMNQFLITFGERCRLKI